MITTDKNNAPPMIDEDDESSIYLNLEPYEDIQIAHCDDNGREDLVK